MRQEKIKTVAAWILVVVCMGVIFWLSSQTADESSAQSTAMLIWLKNIFGDNVFTDFIVRKAAHMLEFTGLSLLVNIALWQTRKKKETAFAIALTSLYAVTDELHQVFVPGRSCQLSDWAIDTAGAILGAICFLIIFAIFCAVKNRKKYIDSKNN